MKLPNPTGLIRVGRTFVVANRPEILFGASITATLGAVVLAAKGGWDARGIVDDAKDERIASPEPPFDTYREYKEEARAMVEPLTKREIANLTWHCYMPAGIATLTAVGSTAGLHYVHVKDKKAMATMALAAIEQVKEDAKAFEKTNLGILTEEEKSNILEERADENGKALIQTSEHDVQEMYLVRDEYTGRDFWASEIRIEDAVNRTNKAMVKNDGNIDLNTFYMWAGVPELERGIEYGWSGSLISVTWEDEHREDGRPIRTFRFSPTPVKGYDNPHS